MPRILQRTGAIMVSICLSIAACQPAGDANNESTADQAPGIFSRPGGVNVGVITDEPGFAELTPGANQRAGFDVDLYRWLGAHVTPLFVPIPVDLEVENRERALQDRTVQLVIATYSITDLRRKSVGFAGPYMYSRQGIMVRTGDSRINSENDLAGKTVCTESGSTSYDQLKNGSLKGRITLTTETGFQRCIERLLRGEVNAMSTDEIVLDGFAQRDPGHLFVVKGATFGAQERYGVGLPPGDIAACKVVTAKLKEFLNTDTWDTFFSVNFPSVSHEDYKLYKPNPDKLDSCE